MGNEDDAFRKWFRHLGELRSMFPNAVLLALSATCTKTIEKRVLNVLGIDKKNVKFFRLSPNKENIKFVVKKGAKFCRSGYVLAYGNFEQP